MARPGMYVKCLFVKEAWRRRGMGRMLLSAVAREAARMGCGRVEWYVVGCNRGAVAFYEEMGAEVLPQWRICRLAVGRLQKPAGEEDGLHGGNQ
ncbi:hypothetical protein HPP92_018617 [Vanilla planifolia]|uniref:N-acetyltransferase domain-containing protein n=1 Tax=Vanilla planifolia TaxID=51239 RepID=A0A835QFY0_VANPL|nr:hypothetical protein HPP92_018617 [Vanilla planifolia]